MIQARVLHGFRHTTASTRFNVNLYAQSKSPIHVNAISNCFEPLQGLVNTWWGWTVSNFRVSVLLRKLLVGAKYHKNSKSNATTLAFILIEFPFIHPSVVRLNSKVLKDGQGGWIISDFPVRSTLKFIYNCVYINCQYYYLVIKNLSILALKLEHFSFIIIQNYSSEGIWSKFSSFEEWPHPLSHLCTV